MRSVVPAAAVPAGIVSPVTATPPPARGLLSVPRPWWALAAFAWLAFSIGLRPLNLPEEGRYVGVAWEMLRSGHWLVPTEDGLPFFHKPPLFYWLTAASMQVFGPNAAAARCAPLLAAMLGGWGLYRLSLPWAGDRVARWTLCVLVTLPFFFGAAQFANLDLLVAAFVALAVLLAGHAALLIRSGRPHRAALVGAWAAAAAGVLAKGLIGVALPGLIVLVWLLATAQFRTILRLLSPAGLAVFALIAAPWFIAVQAQYPGFAHFFFIYQQFERFTAGGFNNPQPWWFYLAAVPLLTLPWSIWLARPGFGRRSGEAAESTLWRHLLWTWIAVVLVFFSIPQSKPVGYAMPLLFPLAALVADTIVAHVGNGSAEPRKLAMASLGVAALFCVAAVIGSTLTDKRDHTALARKLLAARAPADPVVFVGEYFFDIPLHARLAQPVPVIADWKDPKIAERDNWRRELAEAAPFAPALAATLLVDAEHGFALRCGPAPLWAVAKVDDEGRVAAQPGAERIAVSNRTALWRIPPSACAAPAKETSP